MSRTQDAYIRILEERGFIAIKASRMNQPGLCVSTIGFMTMDECQRLICNDCRIEKPCLKHSEDLTSKVLTELQEQW